MLRATPSPSCAQTGREPLILRNFNHLKHEREEVQISIIFCTVVSIPGINWDWGKKTPRIDFSLQSHLWEKQPKRWPSACSLCYSPPRTHSHGERTIILQDSPALSNFLILAVFVKLFCFLFCLLQLSGLCAAL